MDLIATCPCGTQVRAPASASTSVARCPRCGENVFVGPTTAGELPRLAGDELPRGPMPAPQAPGGDDAPVARTDEEKLGRQLALTSYFTPAGWFVALITHNQSDVPSRLAAFHLRQSIGLTILLLLAVVIGQLLEAFSATRAMALGYVGVALVSMVLLWTIGIVSAWNYDEDPVPIVGELFQALLRRLQ